MDLSSENVLAGAAFSSEQDCRVARGGSESRLYKGPILRAPCRQQRYAIDRIAQSSNLGPQFLHFKRTINRVLNLIKRERLGDIVVGTSFHRCYSILDRGISSHQYHDCGRIFRFDFGEQLEAVHLGHSPIAENEIERPIATDQGKRLASAFGYSNLVVAGAQKAAEGVADIFFIVNYEQFCHLDAPRVRKLDYEGAALSGGIQKDATPV